MGQIINPVIVMSPLQKKIKRINTMALRITGSLVALSIVVYLGLMLAGFEFKTINQIIWNITDLAVIKAILSGPLYCFLHSEILDICFNQHKETLTLPLKYWRFLDPIAFGLMSLLIINIIGKLLLLKDNCQDRLQEFVLGFTSAILSCFVFLMLDPIAYALKQPLISLKQFLIFDLSPPLIIIMLLYAITVLRSVSAGGLFSTWGYFCGLAPALILDRSLSLGLIYGFGITLPIFIGIAIPLLYAIAITDTIVNAETGFTHPFIRKSVILPSIALFQLCFQLCMTSWKKIIAFFSAQDIRVD